MKNLKLDPNKIEEELLAFDQKLQSSYETLKEISQIDVAQSKGTELLIMNYTLTDIIDDSLVV